MLSVGSYGHLCQQGLLALEIFLHCSTPLNALRQGLYLACLGDYCRLLHSGSDLQKAFTQAPGKDVGEIGCP